MASNTFVLALVEIAREEGNTASLEKLRNAAFQKMAEGGGELKTLINSNIGGSSIGLTVNKSADVLFAETSEAIRIYNRGLINQTVIDFTYI